MAVNIMQGDSYPILIELEQDGHNLSPDMIDDLEICVGSTMRKTFSAGTVFYDSDLCCWFIIPTQEETFSLNAGTYEVIVRVKYKNQPPSVKGVSVGKINLRKTLSEEVI